MIQSAEVRFSQSSIRASFKDVRSVADLAEGLKSGAIKATDVEPIRLVIRDGKLFTLDNRRLAAFQQAGMRVPYRMATEDEIAAEGWKFTTRKRWYLHSHSRRTMSELDQQAETVQTQQAFSSFIRALRTDLKQNGQAWENADLDAFLEAIAGWVDDMDGYYLNRGMSAPKPDWRVLAHLFAAARHYE
jgi:hypothetical protein